MPSSTLQLFQSLPPINPGKTLEDSPCTKSIFSLLFHTTAKRPFSLFYNARFLTQRPRLAMRVEAKLRSSQVSKGSALPDAKRRKEVVLFDAAPPLSEESTGRGIVGGVREKRRSIGSDMLFLIKKLPKRVLAVLSNLPLAIGEMFTIATLMALARRFVSARVSEREIGGRRRRSLPATVDPRKIHRRKVLRMPEPA